jgi:beta-galactosidase
MKKLFHGVSYYPDLWPESDIERDLAEMKRIGINVVRMGEFAWSTMEPDEARISLEVSRRRNRRRVLYTNSVSAHLAHARAS